MILCGDELVKLIKNKIIGIDPLTEVSIGPASVDLTLDKELRIFDKIEGSLPVASSTDYREITHKVIIEDRYIIKPKELVLGITKEKITLPDNICAWLNSRSRFARLGLMVHITAPFIQPGISAKQVLEIYNAGSNNLELIPGEKLCQVIFQECKGKAKYKGIFQNQEL